MLEGSQIILSLMSDEELLGLSRRLSVNLQLVVHAQRISGTGCRSLGIFNSPMIERGGLTIDDEVAATSIAVAMIEDEVISRWGQRSLRLN